MFAFNFVQAANEQRSVSKYQTNLQLGTKCRQTSLYDTFTASIHLTYYLIII